MWNWKVLLLVGLGLLFLIWIILNSATVKVDFLLFSMIMPVWVVMILSGIFGATLVFAIRVFMSAMKKKRAEEKK